MNAKPLYRCACNPHMAVDYEVAFAHAAQTAVWAGNQETLPSDAKLRFLDGEQEGHRLLGVEGHRLEPLSQEESDLIRASWKGKRCQHCGSDDHCSECCLYRKCMRAEAAMWWVQQQMIAEGKWPEGVPTTMKPEGWKGALDPESLASKEWTKRAIALAESSPGCKDGELREAVIAFARAEPAVEVVGG